MEKKFASLSIFEFQKRFPNEESCYQYLEAEKWPHGYKCIKCSNPKYGQGNRKYVKKCTRCGCQESITSGTLFHHLKFSIQKAFYIVYYISTTKKEISSTELSRKLNLRQKTCWLFKRKVMQAMQSSKAHPMKGKLEVDETVIGGSETGVKGRKNAKKQIVVIGIEKQGKGISRMYGKVIQNSGTKSLKGFFQDYIDPWAHVETDQWVGYTSLKKDYVKLEQKASKNGKAFPKIHRVIMNFKGWLRGIHHHVTHLQAYIDEYSYRFNRHFMKQGIFENLIRRMMLAKPCSYSSLNNRYLNA